MVFPIVGGTQDTGYNISNSLRFNETDDSKLVFDPADDDNKRTFTFSCWMKPAVGDYGGDHNNVFSVRPSAGSYNMLVHRTGGEFLIEMNGTGDVLKTNRLFRDPSAWYHIVMAIDTTDGTASNRVKFYVNGTEETSFATDNRSNLSQNTDMLWGGAQPHQISGDPTGNYFYGGYLAEIHFVTGSQLAPSSFGETNDNGVWIPKKYTGSHGTNGFFLEFQQTGTSANASGIGADTSGGTNHFTPTNLAAIDITVDTPTNNFCTMSSIDTNGQASLSEGNTQLQRGSNYAGCNGTFGVANGKWYWEIKTPSPTTSGENSSFGVTSIPHATIGNNYLATSGTTEWAIIIDNASSDIYKIHNNSTSDYGVNASSNDIFQIALDMDNNKIYFGRNGTFLASGDPAGNSNPAYSSVSGDPFLFPAFSMNGNDTLQANFGNPPNSISSGNADANGHGNFEYAVPSGYFALCTKNLAEFG